MSEDDPRQTDALRTTARWRSAAAWVMYRGVAWALLLMALALGVAVLVVGVVWNVGHRLF